MVCSECWLVNSVFCLEGSWDALVTVYALGEGCCREALKFLVCDVVEYIL